MSVAAAVLLATLALPVPSSAQPEELRFELTAAPFADALPPIGAPFTAASVDFDRDGDADLLINRHNLAPLELWRNDDGHFHCVDRDRSGLDEAIGIRTLYADEDSMRAAVDAIAGDGLFVWHGPKRKGPWHFRFRRARADEALTLALRTNREVRKVTGLAASQFAEPADGAVDIEIAAGVAELEFQVRIEGNSHRLGADWGEPGGPTMYAGADLTPSERLDVWPPDPHGLAWVDAEGSRHPELYLGRGALAGTLRTDQRPKANRYFTATESERLYQLRGEERFPKEWGRARQIQWVDVDWNGQPELYVGNRTSPNALYRRDPETGCWVDRAAEVSLDVFDGDSFAWIDVDRDGWDDIVYLSAKDRIACLRNVQGRSFEPLTTEALGLQPPPLARAERAEPLGEYFETLGLHVADFDSDGRLDLLMTGHRSPGTAHLFLARDDGFEDVTESFGLLPLVDVRAAVLIDADSDGFEDFVCIRKQDVVLLHNRDGQSFESVPISAGWPRENFGTGCVLDADGDGREDLVLVSGPRLFALNRTPSDNTSLLVEFEARSSDVIGTVVTAHYESGRRCAARFGSQRNPPSSQTAEPLRFGVPAGDRITALQVARGSTMSRIDVTPGVPRIVVAP